MTPPATCSGSARIGAAQSTYSSQSCVGVTASKCELTSGKRCDESLIPFPAASAAACSQPVHAADPAEIGHHEGGGVCGKG